MVGHVTHPCCENRSVRLKVVVQRSLTLLQKKSLCLVIASKNILTTYDYLSPAALQEMAESHFLLFAQQQ